MSDLAIGHAISAAVGDGIEVHIDMPSSVGGGGAGPSPGWLFRAAQASCLATLIVRLLAASESAGRFTAVDDDRLTGHIRSLV